MMRKILGDALANQMFRAGGSSGTPCPSGSQYRGSGFCRATKPNYQFFRAGGSSGTSCPSGSQYKGNGFCLARWARLRSIPGKGIAEAGITPDSKQDPCVLGFSQELGGFFYGNSPQEAFLWNCRWIYAKRRWSQRSKARWRIVGARKFSIWIWKKFLSSIFTDPNKYIVKIPLSFYSVKDSIVKEGEAAYIEIFRSYSTKNKHTLTLVADGGSADEGSDYEPLDVELTFEPGEASKKVRINTIKDNSPEFSESVALQLRSSVRDSVPAQIYKGRGELKINDLESNEDSYTAFISVLG